MTMPTIDPERLREIIDLVAKRTMNVDFTWDWPAGVAFHGICRAWEATGKDEYLEFLIRWVDEYLEVGLPPFTVNACAMGHTLLTLHEATGETRYMDLVMQKVRYLREEAPRFGEGVLQHTVSTKNDFPEQAWVDTLFMAAYFLLRVGVTLQDDEIIEDALSQYYWHEELLQDETTNLFYHAWDNLSGTHLSGIFWGRGNAWAALTMAEALRLIDYTYPMFMQIEGALRDLLSALVRLQSEEGLWHTVLTDPSSYLETSASAGIAAALVLYGHPLHGKYVARALNGIVDNIGPDGSVRNVSAGTAVMRDVEAYKQIPKKRVQGWGQGLALVFLSSLLQQHKEHE
ncbi:glycosyl hydrolase family 88 [Spirochaeta thermophila DSM 6578]|uniref:Glycosyl hydrolase family 88 n=1 Tax=Winmispira thermophila (strain ATCC 700085 / DSM 6578 / Z-1203) TaxID=869211 RepID=G0GFS3_WINT7|nr:glycoside hydrolase family 88 protein [Spirochaeta thermophila]AEJ61616.1 glycosyl hydrolase family 88 [Spirochaeta thermophila DSM 6578]